MEFLNLTPESIDPNVVYIVLVMALWLGITAIHVPGTGIVEAMAAIAFIASIILLGNMPTNWVAAVCLVIGVLGFIVIPFIEQRESLLALLSLALQGAGGVLLFHERTVSWALVLVVLALQFTYYRYALMPLLARVRQQKTVEKDDLLIGARGKVVKPLTPIGTVNVHSELWTAISDRRLRTGEEIVVIERRGLQLYVEAAKGKDNPQEDNAEEES